MDIASSSSSAADNPPRREKYDVFISFRGEDTRLGITSHLHAALLQKKIETYIDDKLQSGEEIGPALLEAIEKSTISVIIFSQNYASSTWCLDELVHILKCNNKEGRMVIPVFYDIDPSDVRKQHGSYADAFAELEKRFANSIDKVHKWRDALTTAANLSGFDYSNKSGTEADLIQKVVDHIWTQLCGESSCDLKGFVGIERRIEQIELLLGIHSPDACITVGIWGMGGIGKTTLAEAVFRIHSSKFEASCFLKNVRENSEQAGGLDHLEKTLLKELLKEEVLPVGSTLVRERLGRTKVLIVLDDVIDSLQIERLAGDRIRYGTGSRIIITSRDRGTLGQTVEKDNIYEVELLKPDDALQLFCSRAFKNNSTRRTDYKELAEKAVHYARGVPLALKVLGSLFFNCKSKEDWEDEFNKLKRFPSESIQKVLRISYDRLEKNEKEIFLDAAYFHKGKDVDMVKRMLDVRGFFGTTGIRILIDMSLISIVSKWGREGIIEMHDLLQEMGRTIVQEQCIKDPGERNRLFADEDVYRILKSNTETPNVEAIKVCWFEPLKRADFKKMSNLKMLSSVGRLTASLDLPDSLCYLEWPFYPLESLPSTFSPENLVELHMRGSKVKRLWKEDEILANLQVIDLHECEYLTEVPNLSRSPKIVHINLRCCYSLVEIPSYFQHLDKLTRLELGFCTSLKYLPKMPGNLTYLCLQASGIKELPESVWSNENISYLNIRHCSYLKKLPSSRCKLKNLDLHRCSKFENFPEILEPIEHLKSLSLIHTAVTELPSSICKLKYLESLDLTECSRFSKFPEILEPMEHLKSLSLIRTAVTELPSSICNLKYLDSLDLTECSRFSKFPEILKPMEHLKSLSLIQTAVTKLPSSICNLKYLESLDLTKCSRFSKFPEILEPMEHLKSLRLIQTVVTELPSSICKLKYLESLDLKGCSRFSKFPEILEPMEHLVSLCLEGTVVEMLPSSIGNLNRLQDLNLGWCKQLKDVPTSIYSLTNLKRLSFHGCWRLENLPSSSVGFLSLEELDLSFSGILEIPASIKQASRLSILKLCWCKQLQSIPELPVLCNVNAEGCTSLKTVSSSRTTLTQGWDKPNYCFRVFTNCPKLDNNSRSNIMDEAQIAIMRMATVAPLKYNSWLHNPWPQINIACPGKEIPNWFSYQNEGSSVDIELCPDWFRTGLFGFALSVVLSCVSNVRYKPWRVKANFIVKFMGESHELFSSEYIIPGDRFYSCRHGQHLDFWGCRKLEKLPSSSFGFLSLEELDLSNSGILEIPASIKQASRLSVLDLCSCDQLQSIPELPVLCNVRAKNCKSLKIVSCSRTALTQGWDKPNYCYRDFTNCPKLDNNSRSNIMDEAQIAIMRMATVAPLKYNSWLHNPWPQINIACPGKEIPNWFSYQNEGSSVDIELCPDWFRTGLFGFALSVVLSCVSNVRYKPWRVKANFIVKFMGESHELFSSKYIIQGSYDGQHHVHVWNEAFRSEEVGKNCSPDVYKLAKEASVVFCPYFEDFKNPEDSEDFEDSEGQPASASDMKVERCGICPLYAEDAEKFKFGHVFMSRGPKVEEETRQDDDSKGGGSGDEPQVSGSSHAYEANESN